MPKSRLSNEAEIEEFLGIDKKSLDRLQPQGEVFRISEKGYSNRCVME